jgi:hypothetical protein
LLEQKTTKDERFHGRTEPRHDDALQPAPGHQPHLGVAAFASACRPSAELAKGSDELINQMLINSRLFTDSTCKYEQSLKFNRRRRTALAQQAAR